MIKECCGYEFTRKDIKPPLMNAYQALGTREKKLFGGHAKYFSRTRCPTCEREYILWLKPEFNSYRVLGATPVESSKTKTLPNPDDREAIKAWLDERNVQYFKGAKTEMLYQKILSITQTA